MTRTVTFAEVFNWIPITPDLPDRLSRAQNCLRRFSTPSDVPWRLEGMGPDGEVLPGDRAFREILSGRRVGAIMWRKRGAWTESLSIDPGRGNFDEDRMLGVAVVPHDGAGEAFFIEICGILQVRFASLVPEFDQEVPFQRLTLTSVLTKRFDNDRYAPLVRRIAGRFPKVVDAPWTGNLLYPQKLGWLNYWPEPVCVWAGFPDPVRDAPILPLCYQVDGGAWIVKLTADPLDLERDDHVEALAWAYRRFDMIGRRPEPRAKRPKGKRNESGGATPPVSADEARQIALVAVGAYDVNADDAEDGDELKRMVRDELVSFGLDAHDAARVVAMLTVALEDAATDPLIVRSQHAFHGDPIYQALVDEVRRMQGHE